MLHEALIRDLLYSRATHATWYASFNTLRMPKHRTVIRQSANAAFVRNMFYPKNAVDKSTAIIDSIFSFINFPFDYNRTVINPA